MEGLLEEERVRVKEAEEEAEGLSANLQEAAVRAQDAAKGFEEERRAWREAKEQAEKQTKEEVRHGEAGERRGREGVT